MPCVAANNRLVSRILFLIELAVFWGCFWLLEQPASSVLEQHPKFQKRRRRLGVQQVFLWMKSYGANSPKPTVLYGNAPYIDALRTCLQRWQVVSDARLNITNKSVDPITGETKVSGGCGLKATQAYPPLFGVTVAQEHKHMLETTSEAPIHDDSASDSDDSCSCLDDLLEAA